MGLFSKTPKESSEEIYERLINSEATELFLDCVLHSFSPEGENYEFLMRDPKKNGIYLTFSKHGILRESFVYNSKIHTPKNTFTIDKSGIGFEASGYKELPNSSYVMIFEKIIMGELKNAYSYLRFGAFNCITIEEPSKKDW